MLGRRYAYWVEAWLQGGPQISPSRDVPAGYGGWSHSVPTSSDLMHEALQAVDISIHSEVVDVTSALFLHERGAAAGRASADCLDTIHALSVWPVPAWHAGSCIATAQLPVRVRRQCQQNPRKSNVVGLLPRLVTVRVDESPAVASYRGVGSSKALHALAQHRLHPFGVFLAFKSEDAIIGEADKRGLATQPRPDFFGEPPVQHRAAG